MSGLSELTLSEIARILAESPEVDDALRRVVTRLAQEPEIEWAAVAFVEEDELVVGPTAGSPDEARRLRIPITYAGERVAELLVDGTRPAAPALESVAELLAPHALIGWDTGGEVWEP